ncbi:MAG: NAD(P)/FAD-dependent oxidoreductase, partial [Clostridiales bacterium]|nr:NAD(P)/FAD-dependent oxidoreductase [Clostridiales bacterium]
MAESNICLIGNGAASMEAIIGLRESNFQGQIHLISDSIWPSYNPMLTTYYVAGKIDFEDMFPFGYSMDFYTKYGVNVYFGSKVVELDAENKTIKSAAGQVWNYDKCLVASGASPALPPIMG